MLKEIVNAFFLHQTTGESEIRFAVLDAKIPRVKRAAQLEVNIQPGEHLLEDVGHRNVLEDPALSAPGE